MLELSSANRALLQNNMACHVMAALCSTALIDLRPAQSLMVSLQLASLRHFLTAKSMLSHLLDHLGTCAYCSLTCQHAACQAATVLCVGQTFDSLNGGGGNQGMLVVHLVDNQSGALICAATTHLKAKPGSANDAIRDHQVQRDLLNAYMLRATPLHLMFAGVKQTKCL